MLQLISQFESAFRLDSHPRFDSFNFHLSYEIGESSNYPITGVKAQKEIINYSEW